ncbi:MAG: 8-oxoguanine DNA glycosylase, partial [Lachnospiraceae bacterium]|nr:8-oxoguanine DNA glycosylase [Lachnospiraceae bacterium]
MKITVDDDFDLDKIINSGQCFRPRKTEDGIYRFITGKHTVDIRDITKEAGEKSVNRATELEVSCSQNEWDDVWHQYFDLDTNYRKIRKRIPSDDLFLKNCAKSGAGIR